MDIPQTTVTITKEQAALLIELVQRDIKDSQCRMRMNPDKREALRKRIILGQRLRSQIPECLWGG